MSEKLEKLQVERERIDREIAEEVRSHPAPLADWAAFLVDRIPDGDHRMSENSLVLDTQAVGPGCPKYVYWASYFVALHASSGPGLLVVLRALVALEEQREAERERT